MFYEDQEGKTGKVRKWSFTESREEMFRKIRLSRLGKHWGLSLLAGFLVVFLSLFTVNLKAISIMKSDKILEYSETIISVQRSIDRYLQTLEQLAAELMLNNQNLVLQTAEKQGDFVSPATYQFSELLHNIKTANAFVEDVYLYYPRQNYVVGTQGSYNSRGYYLLSNHLSEEGYIDWKNDILSSHQTGFFFYTDAKEERKLYMRRQMPIGTGSKPSAVLIVCVDGTEFARLLEMTRSHDKSTAVAVYSNANEFYKSGKEEDMHLIKEVLPQLGAMNSAAREIRTDNCIGWRTPSSYGSFYYVVVSDLTVLLESITRIQHLLIAAILLCTMAGGAFSLLLSWKHHRPIENVLRRLNQAPNGRKMDYFEFEQRVNELISENETAARLTGKMLWPLKRGMLSDILIRRVTDPVVIDNLMQNSGITLDYVYFCILLVDVSWAKDENRIQHWMFRAGDVLEHEHSTIDVVPTLMGNTAVFLLNYETSGHDHVRRLKEIYKAESQHELSGCQSEEFMSINQLVPIYEQTLLRLRGKSESGGRLKKGLDVRNMEGAILLERWQKALHLQEYAAASKLVPELFEKYVSTVSDNYVKMSRYYTIVNAALQCIEAEDARRHTELASGFLYTIKNCNEIQMMVLCLKDTFDKIEQQNSQSAAKQQDKLAYKIKQIIEANYSQPYLGLFFISDQVKVSTTYVSKVFKEEYGIGVVEYMNRLRIDGAKKIMESQNLSIKEIAVQVGFTSDIHFIRVFKKYEHTTPGGYKSSINSIKS